MADKFTFYAVDFNTRALEIAHEMVSQMPEAKDLDPRDRASLVRKVFELLSNHSEYHAQLKAKMG